jgi:hypothetical protein
MVNGVGSKARPFAGLVFRCCGAIVEPTLHPAKESRDARGNGREDDDNAEVGHPPVFAPLLSEAVSHSRFPALPHGFESAPLAFVVMSDLLRH